MDSQEPEIEASDQARYKSQQGDTTGVGQAGTIAKAGFDPAGNKVWEEDIHGHRSTYSLDPLYRAVKTSSPQVPDEKVGSAALVSYLTVRYYDLTGNKTYEQDGNLHAATTAYDFAGRIASVTDAVGRVEARVYDSKGNVVEQHFKVGAQDDYLSRVCA